MTILTREQLDEIRGRDMLRCSNCGEYSSGRELKKGKCPKCKGFMEPRGVGGEDRAALLDHIDSLGLMPTMYQNIAARTRSRDHSDDQAGMDAAFGLCIESAKIADFVRKYELQGRYLDNYGIKMGLGEVCRYVALMCDAIGIPMAEVLRVNVEKIKQGFSPPKAGAVHFEKRKPRKSAEELEEEEEGDL